MWRILYDAVEVSTVFQIHRFFPYWQVHCGIEKKDPVVSRPHHTPRQKRKDVTTATIWQCFAHRWLWNPNGGPNDKNQPERERSDPDETVGHTEELWTTEIGLFGLDCDMFSPHQTLFFSRLISHDDRSGDFKQIKFTITPTSSIDYHAFKVLVINQKVTKMSVLDIMASHL